MARFIIEVQHEANIRKCSLAVKILLESGSHYLTHADWGCLDGDHRGWIIVEVDSKEEARHILPPAFRSSAKIVRLNKFTMDEIDEILKHHEHKV